MAHCEVKCCQSGGKLQQKIFTIKAQVVYLKKVQRL